MDHSNLRLRENHESLPIWVTPTHHIFLETFSPFYKQAYDFLIAIAEPVTRPEFIHEYKVSKYSLFAAASVGLSSEDIIHGLERLSKNFLDPALIDFIRTSTEKCGKVKILLGENNRYYLESKDKAILSYLCDQKVICDARIPSHTGNIDMETGFLKTKITAEEVRIAGITVDSRKAMGIEEDRVPSLEETNVFSFEVNPAKIEAVKRTCHECEYPTLEEYEFRQDKLAKNLPINLKPSAKIRPYQEKSLSKMFGNGRARSGIIVLPCGAGKTLVGITSCSTIRKSTLVFCNTTVSVHQWKAQFQKWCNIPDKNICLFTSSDKDPIPKDEAVILITTYNMISFSGQRSDIASVILDEIKEREWGLILLDEVHVAPAKTFRRCVSVTKSRCKLGLTATLLREDDLIEDLFFLIGPKLYEANWLSLQSEGYLATVKCVEVRCPMTPEFYREYLKEDARKQQLMYVMNPNKFRACQYLIKFHEQRGDKVLVFSDIIYALEKYAKDNQRSYLHGKTTESERMDLLSHLQTDSNFNTLFISKVGDTSIDLPDVNVIIQISSHFASRRQEAQRLGRILRPKSTSSDQFNAFFYTLISDDTKEMAYATKRQTFLVDQGYSFQAITYNDLIDDKAPPPGLLYGSKLEQVKLLEHIKALDSSMGGLEDEDDDQKLFMNQRRDAAQQRRKQGTTSSMLSGGVGRIYREVSSSGTSDILLREKRALDAKKKADMKRRKEAEDMRYAE